MQQNLVMYFFRAVPDLTDDPTFYRANILENLSLI